MSTMVVTGIGQSSWDYITIVDSYPEEDTKKEVISWEEQGGGPVATALVALSRLGVRCRFHGIVGDDHIGERIRESLTKEGIDVKGLVKRKGEFSQRAFIIVDKRNGKRTIFWSRATGKELSPNELDMDFLKGSSFLHLDGLMKEVSLHAARMAKTMNIPVMLDAGRLREGMLEIASYCDYVVGSEAFARDIGWDGNTMVFKKRVKELGLNLLTITLGEAGSITFAGNTIIEMPSFRLDAIDTTGAGDVFHGGYIFGILKGWSLQDTLRFATAFAGLKCREVGGRKGIPTLSEVMDFLSRKGS